MIRRDPNLVMVERVATALGPLRERLVFVGGCAAGLLLTDPAAALARVTYDVDLLAEVTALPGYHQLEETFSGLGFKRDLTPDAPICRWRFEEIEVDLIINVIDGRPELMDEVAQAPEALRAYIGARFRELLAQSRFHDALPGLIFPDESHSERLSLMRQRLKSIAEYR